MLEHGFFSFSFGGSIHISQVHFALPPPFSFLFFFLPALDPRVQTLLLSFLPPFLSFLSSAIHTDWIFSSSPSPLFS